MQKWFHITNDRGEFFNYNGATSMFYIEQYGIDAMSYAADCVAECKRRLERVALPGWGPFKVIPEIRSVDAHVARQEQILWAGEKEESITILEAKEYDLIDPSNLPF